MRENTIAGYRVAVNKHLITGVGAHRLDRLEPEHLERLYARMIRNGGAPATAHQAHRTIRAALNETVRRSHLIKNPAVLAKAPQLSEEEVQPYSIQEVQRLLKAAGKRRNSTRWAIALALGLRQSEALGLKWDDVNLAERTLTVRRGRQRPRWRHGCREKCGRRHGGHCPYRVPLRTATAETKSRPGRRSIGLPDELVTLLERHKVEQHNERETAAQLWREGGWLFATPTGEPVNPRTDYDEWKRLLKRAGLRDGRLHDARHTAATVTTQVRRDIARRVGGLLWEPRPDPPTDDDIGDHEVADPRHTGRLEGPATPEAPPAGTGHCDTERKTVVRAYDHTDQSLVQRGEQ